jgi:hypothetical protein
MRNACQYYAAARFAMHAQCIPVCGNLFHHTVEMFLKAGLAQKRKLPELEAMRHDLKKLWRAFKADFPNPILNCHDETISRVNKFDDIRYPEGVIKHGASMSAQWSGPPAKGKTYGSSKTPREYAIVVSGIDDLVADVFKVCSRNPAVFIGINLAAQEAITRNNAHSEFLTKQ